MNSHSAEYQRILKYIFSACFISISVVFFSGNRLSELFSLKILLENSSFFPENIDSPLILSNVKQILSCSFLFLLFFSVGNMVLRFCFGIRAIDCKSALYSIGLGSGVFSAAIMLIALFSGINSFVLTLCFGVISSFSVFYVIYLFGRKHKFRLRPDNHSFPYLVSLLLLCVLLINIFGTQLPPFEYDSIEYHLAGPKEILRNGRYVYFDNNMYMNIPSNLSMIYLLCQGAMGVSGKFVNYIYGFLVLCAIYVFVADKAGRSYALLAAASFYIMGLMTKEGMYAHVEISAAFFTVLSFICILEYFSDRKIFNVILCGIFAGFALGTKYTSVITLILPAFSVLLFFEKGNKKFRVSFLFLLTVLVVFAPWLLKNIIVAKNPFYPIFQNIFAAAEWTPEISRRFAISHYGSAGAAIDNIKLLFDFSINDYFGTPLLLLFPLFCLFSLKNPLVKIGLIWTAVAILLWTVLSKGYVRFLIPVMPVLCVSGILGFFELPIGRFYKNVVRGAIICALFLNFLSCAMLFIEGRYLKVFLSSSDRDFFLSRANNHYTAIMYLNNHIPENTRVLFLGEARTYYSEFVPLYNTVFNRSLLLKNGGDIFKKQYYFDNNIGYVLVNLPELDRIKKTYNYSPVDDIDKYLNWLGRNFERFYADSSGIIIYRI